MLGKRLLTSFLVLFLVYMVVFILPNWSFLMLAILFIILGLNELFSIVEKRGIFVYKYFGIITGCLIPISIYLHRGQHYSDFETLFIVTACMITFVLQFIRREKSQDHFISIAVTLLGLFYISWFFSFFIKLKYLERGAYLVAFLILVTKIGDVAAYFIGKAFGKHKLIPRISPNKTVEGTIGGILAAGVLAVLLRSFIGNVTIIHSFIIGMTLGSLGEIGDLAESLIKRDGGVKDAASYMPGFGGILDIIDSLLFTAPVFYLYVKIFLS